MPVAVQAVVKPRPGADLEQMMALMKESAELWRKHGAQVTCWAVNTGEIGNLVFSAMFETWDAYGKTSGAVAGDPAYMAWQAKRQKAGLTEWVRANVASQLPI